MKQLFQAECYIADSTLFQGCHEKLQFAFQFMLSFVMWIFLMVFLVQVGQIYMQNNFDTVNEYTLS